MDRELWQAHLDVWPVNTLKVIIIRIHNNYVSKYVINGFLYVANEGCFAFKITCKNNQ